MMKNKTKFWQNKKLLITGYEGFLGSNLSRVLLGRGAKIWGLDILTNRKSTILSDRQLRKIRVIKGNVANLSLVFSIIKQNKIEFIFHLAAQAIVGESLQNPLKTFDSNIKGTWNILQAAKDANSVKAIVIASSDKAYGNQKDLPYKEEFPLAGSHPYDASKSCADLLSQAYFNTYRLPVCITRCGNIFGPGDFNFSRIIPDAIRSILQNKTLLIRSDGKFTRDYIYIDDIVNGYLVLAEKMRNPKLHGEAFNFSNEKPLSVLGLVKSICKAAQTPKLDYNILNKAKHEITHQYLSAQKARKILKWSPKYSLEEGLQETIKWYKHILLNKRFIRVK